MKKLRSKINNREFYLNDETEDVTPLDGLPVFNANEIELLKAYKNQITKEFLDNVFDLKSLTGAILQEHHMPQVPIEPVFKEFPYKVNTQTIPEYGKIALSNIRKYLIKE